MEILNIKLRGLSPILMHNPQVMKKASNAVARKIIPTPEDEAKASRYVTPDGNFYVPAVAVRNCLLNGSKGFKAGKVAAMSILAGAVLMVDEFFPMLREGAVINGDDYSIDSRRAVVQRQGIIRSRARVELPWELDCVFGYNSALMPVDVIKMIADNAGQVVGLLDYRVEKKGWFGRFEVIDITSE